MTVVRFICRLIYKNKKKLRVLQPKEGQPTISGQRNIKLRLVLKGTTGNTLSAAMVKR